MPAVYRLACLCRLLVLEAVSRCCERLLLSSYARRLHCLDKCFCIAGQATLKAIRKRKATSLGVYQRSSTKAPASTSLACNGAGRARQPLVQSSVCRNFEGRTGQAGSRRSCLGISASRRRRKVWQVCLAMDHQHKHADHTLSCILQPMLALRRLSNQEVCCIWIRPPTIALQLSFFTTGEAQAVLYCAMQHFTSGRGALCRNG